MPAKGIPPYEYFEAFLETLKSFPVVESSMPTFYAQYPTMDMQNLAVLFPYLKTQHPYMLAQSVASPFSGAAIPPPNQKTKTKPKTRVKARAAPVPLRMVALQNGDLMGPNSARAFHPTSLGASLEVPWQPVSAKKTPTRRSSASPTSYPKPTPVLHETILERSRH